MKSSRERTILIAATFSLVMLILDSPTAIAGARSGIDICLKTVLPSLFPFIFLSSILTATLLSFDSTHTSLICKLFHIPAGAEGILLAGLLGGYPVGAKCINEAVSEGRLSDHHAERMLVFCNASGPAFIFGITGSIFQEQWVPWILWGIHLFSCLCMANILPSGTAFSIATKSSSVQSLTKRLRQSVQIMSEICGWIILMRTIITMANKWCLWLLPEPLQVFISGILELSNGCISLDIILNKRLRFLICSTFLAFGGLCVALQTVSAAPNVNQKMYLPGKCMQALISFLAAYVLQYFLFQNEIEVNLNWLFVVSLTIILAISVYYKRKSKNSSGYLESIGV